MPVASPTTDIPPALAQARSQFLAFCRVECGLAKNSVEAYNRDLRDLLTDLAEHARTTPREVTPRDLAEHLARLKTRRRLSGTSVIRHLATIRVFFRFLESTGLLVANPATDLDRPTRWKKLPGVLSPRQMKILIEAPKPDPEADESAPPLHLRDRALLELMYSLDFLDTSIGDATSLVQEAKSIASSQIGVTSDAATRSNQAVVIDGMLAQLLRLANRDSNGLYIFGGSTATQPPIQELRGGYRYTGHGSGLLAQLGSASDVPITIGGDNAIGEVSARLKGTVDLNPSLTAATRLADLGGGRNLGISKGAVQFSFNGGPTAVVDLSGTDTVQDVANALTSAIQQYETDNSTTILGAGGVSFAGGNLTIDVVAGGTLNFTEIGNGETGTDLGLTQAAFTPANANGADLNPRITLLTPLSSLSGLTVPPGTVRFRFTSGAGSSVVNVDLSSAQTIDDIRNRIETQVQGVRVQINSAGTGLDVSNEIAGPSLSIEPTGTPPGPDTATELGIRSLSAATRVSDYNDGRAGGVRIVDGVTDPILGTTTRALNTDFRIFLGNGQAFDVDLRPQDLVDTQSILDRINSEFTTAIGQPPVIGTAPALAAGPQLWPLRPERER